MNYRHNLPVWLLALVGLLSSFILPPSSLGQSASPQVIPFQGRLTNQAGNQPGTPYTSGQYSIVFNLYSQAVGGSTLWSERHEKVGVVNGMVNVFLGSITALTSVDFSTVKYLGITVDVDNNPATPDPEMVPRQMIIPAFWAKRADNSTKLVGKDWTAIIVDATNLPSNDPSSGFVKGSKIAAASVTSTQLAANAVTTTQIADGAVTAAKVGPNIIGTSQIVDGSVTTPKFADSSVTAAKLAPDAISPAGSVVAYLGLTAPVGWLLCDGSEVSRTTYPNLAPVLADRFGTAANNAVNFKLPDFRGYFLRGVDSLLDFTVLPGAVNISTNAITISNHGFNRTTFPVQISNTGGGLPAPLVANTTYFAIVVDANTIKLATSEANALANTPVDITTQGTGTHKVVSWMDPDKGTRGAIATNGITGNTVGSVQVDDFKSHKHTFFTYNDNYDGGGGLLPAFAKGDDAFFGTKVTWDTMSNTGGNETRPRNAYVNYIIKY